jgi:hypothetical protein
MGAWLGPELAVLSGGVIVPSVVIFVAAFVPMVRRYTIEPSAAAAVAH